MPVHSGPIETPQTVYVRLATQFAQHVLEAPSVNARDANQATC